MPNSVSRPQNRSGPSPYPEAAEHLRGFLDYLQAECGLSLNTRKAYARDLRLFFGSMARQGASDPSVLASGHILQFLRDAKDKGLSSASVARALAAVKMFCRYLVLQRVLQADPSVTIQTPKKWHRLPTVLDRDGVRSLLGSPDEIDDARALRDKAMLSLLYATGMRAGEIAGLNVTDVNFNLGVVRVLGKGSKERIVPVAQEALQDVARYIELRATEPAGTDGGRLFLSRTGRPLMREDVFRIVHKHVRATGLRGNVTPHTLRHAFATDMLSAGADLRSVQEMLGHADLATTEVYLHVTDRRRRDSYFEAHPHARRTDVSRRGPVQQD